MASDEPPAGWLRLMAAEAVGTFLLVFFGVGSVHVAVLTGGLVGLWQVAAVWGIGVGLAIYATAAVSGAHLNPAVTLAVAVFRGFAWRRVGPFMLAQLAGAAAAGGVLFALFRTLLLRFEAANGIVRGEPGSELSGMTFGEYFPNPAILGDAATAGHLVSLPMAMLVEGLGTGLLVLFIFALTDANNDNRPNRGGVAFCIGVTVTAIICILAPLTQAGLNPARDLGPRLVAFAAGWGSIAIPGPRGGFFTVYILAPLLGGLLGGGAYDLLLRPGMRRSDTRPEAPAES